MWRHFAIRWWLLWSAGVFMWSCATAVWAQDPPKEDLLAALSYPLTRQLLAQAVTDDWHQAMVMHAALGRLKLGAAQSDWEAFWTQRCAVTAAGRSPQAALPARVERAISLQRQLKHVTAASATTAMPLRSPFTATNPNDVDLLKAMQTDQDAVTSPLQNRWHEQLLPDTVRLEPIPLDGGAEPQAGQLREVTLRFQLRVRNGWSVPAQLKGVHQFSPAQPTGTQVTRWTSCRLNDLSPLPAGQSRNVACLTEWPAHEVPTRQAAIQRLNAELAQQRLIKSLHLPCAADVALVVRTQAPWQPALLGGDAAQTEGMALVDGADCHAFNRCTADAVNAWLEQPSNQKLLRILMGVGIGTVLYGLWQVSRWLALGAVVVPFALFLIAAYTASTWGAIGLAGVFSNFLNSTLWGILFGISAWVAWGWYRRHRIRVRGGRSPHEKSP